MTKYSPDKVSHNATEEDIDKARENYFKLQDAWKVLSDPDLRKQYDAELTADTLKYDTPADSEVDISELDYNTDDNCYYHPCRCGGEFEIPGSNLHLLSYCNTCSLSIHIIDTSKKK
ncbi:DnaJ-like subfamily C member 24 [Holothuria leucospilota]|uniref:DnaJ-like subfamily C member 24 n=1 Tax=Holothuria leucospilota TaxID=206669 RepID=A0A9Q1BD25_HOLLE|nr:DnaJ-like subfamily C member 24 [Holothuria leucospilota]